MKKTFFLFLSLILSAATAQAQSTHQHAASTTKATSPSEERIVTHQATYDHRPGVGVSIGVSTISPIPGMTVAGGTQFASTVGGGGSLTSILHLSTVDALQILFGIPSTQGGLSFGVGGLYKRTLFGNESAGFHVGAGIALGTVAFNNSTDFALSIPALVGIHYTIANTQISFHFDGGGAFTFVSISGLNGIGGATVTNFSAGPFSSLLGASIAYQF